MPGWAKTCPRERHGRLARDAEEGFCEMVGYLLMDSQNEEVGKENGYCKIITPAARLICSSKRNSDMDLMKSSIG